MSILDKGYKTIKLDLVDVIQQNISLHFHINDEDTSDFYIEITKRKEEIDLSDYEIMLYVMKPNKIVKNMQLTYDKTTKLIYCNLEDEFKDVKGCYIAQIALRDTKTGERIFTRDKFDYFVGRDILSKLDESIIEENSKILQDIIKRIDVLENKQVEIDLSDYYTKDEVNKKTELLPIEEICYILQDAIPVESGTNEFDETIYLFNEGLNYYDLLDKDLFCDITFNDGTNDITKQVEMELSYSRFCGEKDNYFFEFSNSYINSNGDAIDKTYFAVYDEDYTNCFEVKKVTLYYNSISNLFQDKYIKSVDFSKIDNLDWRLNYITKRRHHTLTTDEYSKLKYPLNLKNVNVNETLPNETCTATEDNHVLSDMSGLSLYVNNSESEGFKGIKIEDYNLNKYIIQAYMSDYTDVKVKIIKHIIWNSGNEEYEVAYTNYDETGITERDIYFVDNGGYSCKKYDLYILFAKDDEEYSASVSLSIYKDDFLSTDELVPKDGTAGQILSKKSNANNDVEWKDPQIKYINPTTLEEFCNLDEGMYYIESYQKFKCELEEDEEDPFYIYGLIEVIGELEGYGLFQINCISLMKTINIRTYDKMIGSIYDFPYTLESKMDISTLYGGTAGQVLTKISSVDGHYSWTTIPQLAFNNNGELVVTINGVSKTFVAKE